MNLVTAAKCSLIGTNTRNLYVQDKLIKGTFFANETYGAYKTVEEFWDGEV